MKRIILSFMIVCVSTVLCAQSAKFTYTATLSIYVDDSIDTYNYLKQNPCLDFETSLANTAGQELKNTLIPMFTHNELKKMVDLDIEYYQRCLKNNSFYNTTASAEKQKIDRKLADYAGLQRECGKLIADCAANNILNGYKDDFAFFRWDSYKYYSLFHSIISNKAFRDAIYNKAVDLLCKMVAYYPKDYRAKLIREFSASLKVLDEAPKHHYEIRKDYSYGWEQLVFYIDGRQNVMFGYGLTGFLFRRIYLDNVPYAEVREKTANLIAKVKAIDTSKNADVLCKYTINNEILYCIGSEENFFVSLANNKKMITYTNPLEIAYNTNIIKVRYNEGQRYYQISNHRWCNTELKEVIIDKFMNVIYHRPNTLSQPIKITQL